jgi:hypothetical protein
MKKNGYKVSWKILLPSSQTTISDKGEIIVDVGQPRLLSIGPSYGKILAFPM